MEAQEVLTRDDFVRVGACSDGVAAFARRHGITKSAVPAEELLRLARGDDRSWILKAAGLDGYGSGSGDGYGYGGDPD